MMRVPVLDLKDPLAEIGPELEEAAVRVVRSGWYIMGKELEAFEAEFASSCEAKHAIGVGNGLEAISLILKAAGIEAGDEVIVASNTYIATWLGVSYAGAIIVPVEPDILTYEATLDDPQVYTRPWTIRMLMYRHKEPNATLLEYECNAYLEDAAKERNNK